MQRSATILSSLKNARTFKVVGTWYKPHFNHEGHVEGDNHLHLKPRDSILESRNFRGWSLEDRGSSFKFRVEKYELVVRANTNQCYP